MALRWPWGRDRGEEKDHHVKAVLTEAVKAQAQALVRDLRATLEDLDEVLAAEAASTLGDGPDGHTGVPDDPGRTHGTGTA